MPHKSLPQKKKTPSSHSSRKLIILGSVIFIVLLGMTFATVSIINLLASESTKTTRPSTQDAQTIVDNVSQLIDLPTEPKPEIMVVDDELKLKKWQPFFEKAKKGDYILIYKNQIILYRPNAHRIINIAPVNGNGSP